MQFEDWFFTHTNSSVEMMDDMHKAFLAGKASAIPDGYVLVPFGDLKELRDSISGDYFKSQEWELKCIEAMIASAQKEMK